MKYLLYTLFAFTLFSCRSVDNDESATTVDQPIALHPQNPHYFIYKGKTLGLITSAEHYGAVLNLDFDYKTYLNTLATEGMNYTRVFTGSYFENPGDFGIKHNTLAPASGRVITPWVKNEEGKYDLSSFNDDYFVRIKDFLRIAQEKGIIVEITLFSSIYQDKNWEIVPQNPANNINITEDITRFEAQTINNKSLMGFQKAFVAKMVSELNEFDNIFFEIQNEPWSDHNVPVYNIVNKDELKENDWQNKADLASDEVLEWHKVIAKAITATESSLKKKHLIAQNYVNYRASIPEVDSNISIINFHYAWPEAAEWNYHYDKVIGSDESGFAGTTDQVYRRQAWQFMLSGGGLFNSLDYSFFVGKEDGTGENIGPGGGSPTLRSQLKTLSTFLHSFELEKLKPTKALVKKAPGLISYALSDGEKATAVYLRSTGTKRSTLELQMKDGDYEIQYLNTLSDEYLPKTNAKSENGIVTIPVNIPDGEIALKIVRD
ncbi:hypothetical protein SAMN06298216_0142 [Spirosomataceae bacterium TFI 002]|nr:hypothetical protein SAMN06298216_0142 [Spirosomataceae bacterium TFI 002]